MPLDEYISRQFAQRGVRFYHAENLRNFLTYCDARALLCREELMQRDPDYYTRFYSDDGDRALGALGRIFGNLYDFGAVFSRAPRTIPNIYGPITLAFRPAAFAAMSDIRITPASIATHSVTWTLVTLSAPAQIDELLAGDDYGSPIAPAWHFCELSAGCRTLSFEHLERVLVEPVTVGGRRLVDLVRAEVSVRSIDVDVQERGFRYAPNADALRELALLCEGLPPDIEHASWTLDEAALPQSFADHPPDRRRRVPGWCRYFYYGTLEEVRRRDEPESFEDYDDRTVCTLCDPGSERPPALVNYTRSDEGIPGSSSVDIGRCEWCDGLSIRCRTCGTVQGIYESSYGADRSTIQECEGGCGLRFIVRNSFDPRDGGGGTDIEVLPDAPAMIDDDGDGD
jgi:hypothetical protein